MASSALDVTQRPNDVMALDAKTGRVFWQFRHTCVLGPAEACYPVNPDDVLDLAVIAAEIGMTPAALRQRLYRAVTRIRKSVVASNPPTPRPRFARGRRRTATTTAAI